MADPMRIRAQASGGNAVVAERLMTLAPGAGHLVHMPGHLFYRVGRYGDAIRVNIEATKADEAHFKSSPIAGIYRFAYYPHNVHFIVSAAQMAGDLDSTVAQAEKLRSILNPEVTLTVPFVQPVDAAPYLAHAHFSTPATIMALPAPDPLLDQLRQGTHRESYIAQVLGPLRQLRDLLRRTLHPADAELIDHRADIAPGAIAANLKGCR